MKYASPIEGRLRRLGFIREPEKSDLNYDSLYTFKSENMTIRVGQLERGKWWAIVRNFKGRRFHGGQWEVVFNEVMPPAKMLGLIDDFRIWINLESSSSHL